MNRVLPVLLFLSLCIAATAERIELRDGWALQTATAVVAPPEQVATPGFDHNGWYIVSVPTTVLAALVEHGVYPDPFFGDNITKIPGYRPSPWLVMSGDSPFYPAWWYRTEFEVPEAMAGKVLRLHLDGINYRANVWLNGRKLAGDDQVYGMFRRFEFAVNDYVKLGEKNCLALEITAPGHLPDKSYPTKQMEATTGWDDHNPQPPDLNMGIWQDVYITASGPVTLRHPYVRSEVELPGLKTARLTVSVQAANVSNAPVEAVIAGRIEERRFEKAVELAPGEARDVVFEPAEFAPLTVDNPRIWWPVGLGAQELYTLEVEARVGEVVSEATGTSFGIRHATTYINGEGWRAYQVNGEDILIRGGAWMTSDMLLRLSPKRYEALVRYAAEANLNMLRSEGFSIRETDTFYDLCDRYGVMATQQLFGRSIPDEPLAIACVEDTILRIRNHPSLVHFLGHDETFPTKTLDAAYQDIIARRIPDRTYQPHSGAFEIEERFETGGTRTGSLQVWTYAPPNHYYGDNETNAWGFAQSGGIGGVFASYGSMRRMLPEDAQWPPFTKSWSLHTVTQGGNYFKPVLKAINDRYGEPADLADFCRKAFALNYECARGMFEAYGRNKYAATGITTWKYDAAWPASPTWQYIDYYLVPTGAYFGAKKACEPVHVLYAYDDRGVYVVNNTRAALAGLVAEAHLYNQDMTEKWAQSKPVDVAADGKAIAFPVEFPADLTKTHFLSLVLKDAAGSVVSQNFYWLSTVEDKANPHEALFAVPLSTADYKELAGLPAVALEKEIQVTREGTEAVAKIRLTNPAKSLAFFVRLSLLDKAEGQELAPVYWSDNCLSILPGTTREVTARYALDALAEGVNPVLAVEGFNVR